MTDVAGPAPPPGGDVGTALRSALRGRAPRVLVVLGSGLGSVADHVEDAVAIRFADVGLPDPTVPGHAGRFVAGRLGGVDVLVQQGRLHLYEGVGAAVVTAAVRAAADAGVEILVATNAAGGIRDDLAPGDLMVLADHLNLTGTSPLVGMVPPRFVDLKDAYDPHLRGVLHGAAKATGERLVEGVYAGLVGPAFETPAEIHMLRALGADAVGMSTVSEVIAARERGLRVVGASLVTNVHRSGGTATDHAEVLAVGAEAGPRLARVLVTALAAM